MGLLGSFGALMGFGLISGAIDYIGNADERALAWQEESQEICNRAYLKYASDLTVGGRAYAEEEARTNPDAAYCQ